MEPRQKCLLSAALLSDPLQGAAADGSILREEDRGGGETQTNVIVGVWR